MNTSDRELLELAAKAAGLPSACIESSSVLYRWWNSLVNSGDALELLTKLPFCELYVSEIGATVSWRRADDSGHGFKCDEYASEHGGDLNAATRHAITRAAAEIGRSMK